jgi:hypothetical protein
VHQSADGAFDKRGIYSVIFRWERGNGFLAMYGRREEKSLSGRRCAQGFSNFSRSTAAKTFVAVFGVGNEAEGFVSATFTTARAWGASFAVEFYPVSDLKALEIGIRHFYCPS